MDLSSGLSDRFDHLFILTARANYGSGYASLPWHFRFKTDPADDCGESICIYILGIRKVCYTIIITLFRYTYIHCAE